jgi:hypothetical protein
VNLTNAGTQSKRESGFSEMVKALFEDDAEICPNCGNIYRIVWLKTGDDFNDFGYRNCPFCGLLVDELAHVGMT